MRYKNSMLSHLVVYPVAGVDLRERKALPDGGTSTCAATCTGVCSIMAAFSSTSATGAATFSSRAAVSSDAPASVSAGVSAPSDLLGTSRAAPVFASLLAFRRRFQARNSLINPTTIGIPTGANKGVYTANLCSSGWDQRHVPASSILIRLVHA